jgi:phosphatidylglycerol:prolipoprotein diacylglycerol transferase
MGRRQKFSGQVFLLYIMVYAALRFGLELFRGDTDRGYWIDPYISTSQGIALMAVFLGLGAYLWRRRYAT